MAVCEGRKRWRVKEGKDSEERMAMEVFALGKEGKERMEWKGREGQQGKEGKDSKKRPQRRKDGEERKDFLIRS